MANIASLRISSPTAAESEASPSFVTPLTPLVVKDADGPTQPWCEPVKTPAPTPGQAPVIAQLADPDVANTIAEGDAHLAAGRVAEALAAFSASIQPYEDAIGGAAAFANSNQLTGLYLRRADAAIQAEKYQDALLDANAATARDANCVRGYILAGSAARAMGDLKEAAIQFTAACVLDPLSDVYAQLLAASLGGLRPDVEFLTKIILQDRFIPCTRFVYLVTSALLKLLVPKKYSGAPGLVEKKSDAEVLSPPAAPASPGDVQHSTAVGVDGVDDDALNHFLQFTRAQEFTQSGAGRALRSLAVNTHPMLTEPLTELVLVLDTFTNDPHGVHY